MSSARGEQPPRDLQLALVVRGNVDRETLEVLRGCGLGSPPRVQLCRRRDRRLGRHATLAIRDDLIAHPIHDDLVDRKSSLFTAAAMDQW
jgi:hypothetical protein